MTPQEFTYAREYLTKIIKNEPIAKTEEVFWKYRFYVDAEKSNDVKYNHKLLTYLIIKRKGYLEGMLR
jgi:hypothetical protein